MVLFLVTFFFYFDLKSCCHCRDISFVMGNCVHYCIDLHFNQTSNYLNGKYSQTLIWGIVGSSLSEIMQVGRKELATYMPQQRITKTAIALGCSHKEKISSGTFCIFIL